MKNKVWEGTTLVNLPDGRYRPRMNSPDTSRTEPSVPPVVETWRKLATYLFVFGATGTLVELTLLGHTENRPQWVPVVLLGLGIVAGLAVVVRTGPATVKALRFIAAAYLPAAAAGLYFHLRSNIEFELEMRPAIEGAELVRETLTGAIPALAPGALAQLGLLGLLVCFRHPALSVARAVTTGPTNHPQD